MLIAARVGSGRRRSEVSSDIGAVLRDLLKVDHARITHVLTGRATWLTSAPPIDRLDQTIARSPDLQSLDCTVVVQPTGIALDVNIADAPALRAILGAVGIADSTADSLADAILDWRDSGDVARPLGAKREAYARRHEPLPRNAPFVDMRELRLVRGYVAALARAPALDTLLTTEPDRILLDRAPAPVLATLPGMTPAAVDEVLFERATGVPLADVGTLAAVLPATARDSLNAHAIAITSLTTAAPAAWIVHAWASSGASPSVRSEIEVRLVLAGTRAAILRRRVWP